MARYTGKSFWADCKMVREITGWTAARIARLRVAGKIEYRQLGDKQSYEYNIDSIHPYFIKKAPVTAEAHS